MAKGIALAKCDPLLIDIPVIVKEVYNNYDNKAEAMNNW
jgi:hypothetical protein